MQRGYREAVAEEKKLRWLHGLLCWRSPQERFHKNTNRVGKAAPAHTALKSKKIRKEIKKGDAMFANFTQITPRMRVLSDSQIKEIHLGACDILERTGSLIHNEEARNLLYSHGAVVENNGLVRIPSYLVDRALNTVPERFVLCDRDGNRAYRMETGKTHFSPLVDNIDIIDPQTRQRRKFVAADAARMAKIMDYTRHMDVVQVGAFAADLPPEIVDRVNIREMMLHQRKAISFSPSGPDALLDVIEMASIIAGGREQLKMNPYMMKLGEPISPLVHDDHAIKELMICAEHRMPIVYYPIPMGGATAPATSAGLLAQSHAESLAGLVIHQLTNPGAPFLYGGVATVMDMKSTVCVYGGPELYLQCAALSDIATYFHLPFWGTAGCTDTKALDTQGAAEIGMSCLLAVLTGANLVHDVALLDQASLVDPTTVLFCDEVIDHVKHFMRGIQVTDETLAIDVIDSVGAGGNYLIQKHTLQNFRSFWQPTYFTRPAMGVSEAHDLIKALNEKVIDIEENYEVPPLDPDKVAALQELEKKWLKG
nr:trimethylamine methyltransferase family protein [Desulforhopalus singaporensis]